MRVFPQQHQGRSERGARVADRMGCHGSQGIGAGTSRALAGGFGRPFLGRSRRSSRLSGWARLFLVMGLIASLGWHRGVLQSVAWVGMVVQYSQDASMAEAFEKTFDGQHPCRLCLTLREHQNSDPDSEAQRVSGVPKLDPAHPWQAFELEFPPSVTGISGGLFLAQARLEPPPTPPPRGSFGC